MGLKLDNKIKLDNVETYKESTIEYLQNNFSKFDSIENIEKEINDINEYVNLTNIEEPKNIYTFDGNVISDNKIKNAELKILNGDIFFEHTAAGEATRLKLGTKYIINVKEKLTFEKIKGLMMIESGDEISIDDIKKRAGCEIEDLLNLSLGSRHMIQLLFDIKKIAEKYHRDINTVMKLQKMLIILNEKTYETILKEFVKFDFFKMKPENVFFMVQKSFYGINYKNGSFFYDETSGKRLHNHGQMVMQQTMDDEVFHLDPNNNYDKKYLKSSEFGNTLKKCEDKISYNIEDLKYLTKSIDLKSLAVAIDMKDRGYNMIMEIVANNPVKPQKGGMAAYDPKLEKNVMIESFQLKGIKNEDIKYLNKNFNHYPNPYQAWKFLKEQGLPMPLSIKNNHIYFQPVQGDLNFRLKTQFVRRKQLKPIQSWKSAATTPEAIFAMFKQDNQEGFKAFVKDFLNIDLN